MDKRDCAICGSDIWDEYYMIYDAIWIEASTDVELCSDRDLGSVRIKETGGVDGREICIGCIEERLKRKLTYKDFPVLPVNIMALHDGSDRIKNRLEGFTYEH